MDDGKTWFFEGMGLAVGVFIPPSGDGTISVRTEEERRQMEVSRVTLQSFAKWMIEQTDPGPKIDASKDGGT